MKHLKGSCLCGSVSFEVLDNFKMFFFCFCEQCRKLSGSAHAANLFAEPSDIKWIKGKESTLRYDHPKRQFTKVFCQVCGTAMPYESKSGGLLIVPAACLDEEPSKAVDAHLYCSEQKDWYKKGLNSEKRQKLNST